MATYLFCVTVVDYFEYKYVIASPSGGVTWEIGSNREVAIRARLENVAVVDTFHARGPVHHVKHVIPSIHSASSEQRKPGRHSTKERRERAALAMPTASVPNPVSVDETWGDATAASASSDDLVVTDALAKATYLSTDTDMDTLGRCVQALASPVPADTLIRTLVIAVTQKPRFLTLLALNVRTTLRAAKVIDMRQGLAEFVSVGASGSSGRRHKRREFASASVVVIDITPPLRIPARCSVGISVSEGCVWTSSARVDQVMVGKAPSIYKHEDAEIMVNSVSSVLGWIVIDKRGAMFGSSRCIEALMGDEVGGVLDAADSTPEPDVFPAAEGRSSSAPTAVVHDADPLLFVLPEQFSRKVDAELVDAAAFSPPVVTGMVAPPKLRRGESVPTEVYSSSDSHVVSCPNCARKVPKTEFGQHMFLCYHVNTRPSEAAPVRGGSGSAEAFRSVAVPRSPSGDWVTHLIRSIQSREASASASAPLFENIDDLVKRKEQLGQQLRDVTASIRVAERENDLSLRMRLFHQRRVILTAQEDVKREVDEVTDAMKAWNGGMIGTGRRGALARLVSAWLLREQQVKTETSMWSTRLQLANTRIQALACELSECRSVTEQLSDKYRAQLQSAERSWQSKFQSVQDESSVRLETQTREFAERSAALTAQLSALTAEQERLTKQLASSETTMLGLQRAKSEEDCIVCFAAEIRTCLEPCMHVCLCEGCAGSLRTCPVCSASISSVRRIFKVTCG